MIERIEKEAGRWTDYGNTKGTDRVKTTYEVYEACLATGMDMKQNCACYPHLQGP